MNRYSLSEETLNNLLKYLGGKPYVESAALVDSIRNDAKPLPNEGTASAVSEDQAAS